MACFNTKTYKLVIKNFLGYLLIKIDMKQYFRILFWCCLPLLLFNTTSLNAQTNPKYYYVAPDGNDSNMGTESLPWKTLSKAASMATAGTTVFIRQGTYKERLVPLNSGTAEEPVIFAAYPGDTVTITGVEMELPTEWYNAGLIWINGLNYIKISGLRVINSLSTGIDVQNSSYITIEKNYVDSTYDSGIHIHFSENVVVEANEVLHGAMVVDNECISFGLTNLFEIKNNRVHDALSIGIDVKVGSSNGIVCNNETYNTATGIYTDAWNSHEFDIDIFDNISHDNTFGIVIGAEDDGLIENIRVHHNKASNNFRGLWVAGAGPGLHPLKNIKVYANEFYENGFGMEIGGYTGTTIDSIEIFNNLIYYNKSTGVRITRYDGPDGEYVMQNLAIMNNTICGNGTVGNGWDADNGGINIFNFLPENIIIQNNIYSENTVGTIHVSPEIPSDSVNIDYNFFDGFQNLVDERAGTNAVYGSPLFVDNLNYNYHLQANSPAIDKGDPDQQYNDPEDPGNPGFALSPALGTVRNDMGAYGGPFASSWDPKSYASILPAPAQVFPYNTSADVPTTLLLGWNGPFGATSYRLQVSTSSGFSTMVIDSSDIKGSSCAIMELVKNTQYYWRVNASNAAGAGSFSGTWSFTTASITGINDQISDEKVRIYPVPVDGILKINGIDKEFTTISILSQEGKLLKQIKGTEIQEIDVSELHTGVYLVKISNSHTVITKKIVKL